MSNVFFWGLTTKDFENSLWNSIYETAALLTGFAGAVTANLIVQTLLRNDKYNRQGQQNKSFLIPGTLIGIGAGVAASVYLSNRMSHVTFIAEKALKLLIIGLVGAPLGVIPLITGGGVNGYFGRTPLYVMGSIGAVTGGIFSAAVIRRRT